MIEISPGLKIEENQIQYEFVRAGGPGGQNVDKVSSAVQLRFDLAGSDLPEEVKTRLAKIAGARVNKDGVLVLHARQYRTQEQNRFAVRQRFIELLRESARKPKPRKATKPGVTARAAKLGAKRRRGEIKRLRRYVPEDWE
jgi:ribosome-associated protein